MNIRLPIWVIGKRILSGRYEVRCRNIGVSGLRAYSGPSYLEIVDTISNKRLISWYSGIYISSLGGMGDLSKEENQFLLKCREHVVDAEKEKEDARMERELYETILGKQMVNK